MSGPAPPNPGAPKHNPHRPKASIFAKYPGRWATGVALAGAAYLYIANSPTPTTEPIVNFRTPGVQNIERAYSNGGATPTHTKAYGGTKQGNRDEVALREGGGTGASKSGSPIAKPGMGDDQRPSDKTKTEEALNATMYGSGKGKISIATLVRPLVI